MEDYMKDYSKSANMLGDQIYRELFLSPQAVMPALEQRILQSAAKSSGHDENNELLDYIGEQWGIAGEYVPKSLKKITQLSASAIPHKRGWLFPLRIAQCAALVDYRLQARLIDCQSSEDPHAVATEMIHGLGAKAISLLQQADPDLGQDLVRPVAEWNKATNNKVAALCIKRFDFADVYRKLVDFAQPEQLSMALQGNPTQCIQRTYEALYRINTAAVTVGSSIQFDLMPLEAPQAK